jgi:predicted DNA-binding protein (UPF0251 family)
MPRPQKLRCVRCKPDAAYFKPRGIPLIDLEEVSITMDELEAIRLVIMRNFITGRSKK